MSTSKIEAITMQRGKYANAVCNNAKANTMLITEDRNKNYSHMLLKRWSSPHSPFHLQVNSPPHCRVNYVCFVNGHAFEIQVDRQTVSTMSVRTIQTEANDNEW